MREKKLVVLSGGTGSAKLIRGLGGVSDTPFTIIVNVGDNVWMHGLYVCPDIDTIMYCLSGLLDEERTWGIRGDTFSFLSQLESYGADTWFNLGDRDLATHCLRTKWIRERVALSEATSRLGRALGVRHTIIPASNDHVETRIVTEEGPLHLQEYWVRRKAADKVQGIQYLGVDKASPAPAVLEAIAESALIILAPANPLTSIGPILAIPQIRGSLQRTRALKMAVSPIIGRRAVSGPAGKMMEDLGLEVSPLTVARLYGDFLDIFAIDRSDHLMARDMENLGLKVFETDIMMRDREGEARFARALLGAAEELAS